MTERLWKINLFLAADKNFVGKGAELAELGLGGAFSGEEDNG